MTIFAALRKGLAVAAALAVVATLGDMSAHASTILDVTYKTSGVFGAGPSATNVYSDGGATVTFDGIDDGFGLLEYNGDGLTVETPSNAIFGLFTASSDANDVAVSAPFTLIIEQISPSTTDDTIFTSTLSGTLSITSSQAFIKFDNVGPVENGIVRYRLINTDAEGRLNLSPLGLPSTLMGEITAVPEPASLALVGLGLIGIPGLMFAQRRRRRNTTS